MNQLIKTIANFVGITVASGPFRLTRLTANASGDAILAKFLGTYELEIFPEIEAMVARNPALIVNVGAAEGYYAVGLARRLPRAKVLAYEAKLEWQERIRRLARLNGVADRIEIRGFFDRPELDHVRKQARDVAGTMVLMDIEGGEWTLLDACDFRDWGRTDFLIELHEDDAGQQATRWRAAFGVTHLVTEKWTRDRKFSDVRSVRWRFILRPMRQWVMQRLNEGRVKKMRWFYCQARKLVEQV